MNRWAGLALISSVLFFADTLTIFFLPFFLFCDILRPDHCVVLIHGLGLEKGLRLTTALLPSLNLVTPSDIIGLDLLDHLPVAIEVEPTPILVLCRMPSIPLGN